MGASIEWRKKLVNPVFYNKLEEEISSYKPEEISVDKWGAPFSW
jgi:hypothetical protein